MLRVVAHGEIVAGEGPVDGVDASPQRSVEDASDHLDGLLSSFDRPSRAKSCGEELTFVFDSLRSKITEVEDAGYLDYSAPVALAGLCLLADKLPLALAGNRAPAASGKLMLSNSKVDELRAAHDLVLSFGAALIEQVSTETTILDSPEVTELVGLTSEMLLSYSVIWGWLQGKGTDLQGRRTDAVGACTKFRSQCLELECCLDTLPSGFGGWKSAFMAIRQRQQLHS